MNKKAHLKGGVPKKSDFLVLTDAHNHLAFKNAHNHLAFKMPTIIWLLKPDFFGICLKWLWVQDSNLQPMV